MPTVFFPPRFGVEHATDNGGLKLNDVPVYLIYWSPAWGSVQGPGVPGSGQITSAIQDILSGPYLSSLTQYGVNAQAHIVNSKINVSTPSNPFSDGGVSSNLRSAVLDVGEPDSDSLSRMPVFVVVTPPGVSSQKGGASYNEMQFTLDTIFDLDAVPIIWLGGIAPSGLPSSANLLDTYTDNFSHEMAEAITDIGNGSFGYGSGITVTPGASWTGGGDSQIGDREAQLNTYRVQGHLVQSYWSEHDRSYIVPDGNTQAVSVANGVLTVNDDQNANLNDTIVVDQLPDGETTVTLNGEVFRFDSGAISTIQVNCHTGANEVDVNGLDPTVNVRVQSGTGTCRVNVGAAGRTLGRVQGNVTVNGNGAGTSLTVTDSLPDPRISNLAFVLGAGSVQRSGAGTVSYNSVGGVTAVGGNATDAFRVDAVNTPTTIRPGAGATTIDIGSSLRNLDLIASPLTIQGNGRSTTLNIDDQNTGGAITYAIDAGHIARSRAGTITYGGLTALNVSGGSVQDTFAIAGTSVPTMIVAGSGSNSVNVDPSPGSLALLQGTLTVHGGGSATSLFLNDAGEPGNITYTVNPAAVSRSGIADVGYSGLTSLTLAGGSGTDVINIERLSVPTTFQDDGAGADQVNVSPTAQNLDAIGDLTVNAVHGQVSVIVDDRQNPNPPGFGTVNSTAYTMNEALLTRNATSHDLFSGTTTSKVSTIHYMNLRSLTVDTGHTANTDVINGVLAFTTLNGGGDHGDSVSVTPRLASTGNAVTIDAHGGTVTISDVGTWDQDNDAFTITNNVTWDITDGSVAHTNHVQEIDYNPSPIGPRRHVRNWTAAQTINYAGAHALTVDGAAVQETYNVLSTAAGTPLTVAAGAGSNRFVVGQAGSVKAIRGAVGLSGSGFGDTLTIDDSRSTGRDQVTVDNGRIGAAASDLFFGTGGSLSFGGIASVALSLSNANDDAVQLTPDRAAAFTVIGSQAAYQAGHGARMTLNRTGVTSATNVPAGPGSGRWTFGNRQAVTYNGFAATM